MDKFKKEIKEYIEERNWELLDHPSDIAKSITIEAAELLEIFQWKNYSADEIKNDPELYQNTKDEIADVLIYITEMAVSLDLNLEEVFRNKFEKVKKKYDPERLAKGEDEYLKIKKESRGQL